MRKGAELRRLALPDFQQFWAEGFVEAPPPGKDFVLVRGFSPRSPAASAQYGLGTSRLSQATGALTALVEIERYDAPAPPVQAFTPPAHAAGTRRSA